MKVAVVGGGYVGLVSAICLCEYEHHVCVVERQTERLKNLKQGKTAVYEVGLDQCLKRAIETKKIRFEGNLEESISDVEAIIVAVATTCDEGTDSDLSELHQVIKTIALSIPSNKYTGIIIKTSVPVGTCSTILKNMMFMRPDLISGKQYDIISNPGFLREGTAIKDFMAPNCSVIGIDAESQMAKDLIEKLYAPMLDMKIPFIYTNYETAELIRAANTGFTAVRMAYINEMSEICERASADLDTLAKGIALCQEMDYKTLAVSPGIGGTSLPRTMRILINTAAALGVDLEVLDGVLKSNQKRIHGISDRIKKMIEDEHSLSNKKVSILGLTYTPLTNDVRESASLQVIEDLLADGVSVYAYDPLFKPKSEYLTRIPEKIRNNENFHITESVYEATTESDIMVIMTNWSEFAFLDFNKIHELMNRRGTSDPIILDYKNMLTQNKLPHFEYIAQGILK